MLAQQNGCLDHLAKAAVGMSGKAAVTVGILVPEETGIVAGATASKRIGEGDEMAGGVVHELHAPADPLSKQPDGRGVTAIIAVRPAMHLECAIAQAVALLGKISERLGRGEPAAIASEPGRRVGRESLALLAAEKVGDRCVAPLAREIPQHVVDLARANPVFLAKPAARVLVDLLARITVPANDALARENESAAPCRCARRHILLARRRRSRP